MIDLFWQIHQKCTCDEWPFFKKYWNSMMHRNLVWDNFELMFAKIHGYSSHFKIYICISIIISHCLKTIFSFFTFKELYFHIFHNERTIFLHLYNYIFIFITFLEIIFSPDYEDKHFDPLSFFKLLPFLSNHIFHCHSQQKHPSTSVLKDSLE